MVVNSYFTDDELITQLKLQFSREEQNNIDFKYWINTIKQTSDGLVVNVKNRKFLVHPILGVVIREL